MSNVDLATEFTNMITAERGYQANSKVITTADEMLQSVVNMPPGLRPPDGLRGAAIEGCRPPLHFDQARGTPMITLHRLGHAVEPFQLNPDLIMTVEANPDTVITLTTGTKIVVAEPPERVADDVRCYRIDMLAGALSAGPSCAQAAFRSTRPPRCASSRLRRCSLIRPPPSTTRPEVFCWPADTELR